MKKRLTKSVAFSFIIAFAGIALADVAQASFKAKNAKIGFVRMSDLMNSSAAKDSEKIVKKVQAEQEAKIKRMQDDLQKQLKALQAKEKIGESSAMAELQEKINDGKKALDLAMQSANEKMQRVAGQEMQKLGKLAEQKAKALLKSLGLDIILTETGGVLAYSDDIDITSLLVDSMNSTSEAKDNSDAKSKK